MLYFVLLSFKITLLSREFFSSVLGKGLCEGLLTKRFTRNLTCQREHMFLGIFTSIPVIQRLSHNTVKLLLMEFILYKNNG